MADQATNSVTQPIEPPETGWVKNPNATNANVKAYHYDPAAQMLTMRFGDATLYQYHDVPAELAGKFATEKSWGGFFAREIKNAYHTVRMKDGVTVLDKKGRLANG